MYNSRLLAAVEAELKPVAYTCPNNILELDKKRDGYAGMPDYLVGYYKPVSEYNAKLISLPLIKEQP